MEEEEGGNKGASNHRRWLPSSLTDFCVENKVKFTAEELRLIMDFKHNICNITVIAHVDHNLPLAITIALQQLKGFLGIKEFTKKTDVISVMQSVVSP
ncbi:hypothetical protein RIF29_37887 [Crotalaria pallida]|uniref:Uncharacterized protein n=1 Tax=Crotalaria pallida TaxID=3830 RepID=A0AAN9E0N0_CROPI